MHNWIYLTLTFLILSFSTSISAQDKEPRPDGIEMIKGLKFASLTFSLHDRNSNNEQGLLDFYVENQNLEWGFSVDGGFIFKPNVGVGLGLTYSQEKLNNSIKGFGGVITDNDNFTEEYTIRPFIKNFIPLDKGNRFFVINQTEILYSFSKINNTSTTIGTVTETTGDKHTYGVGIRPGLLIFVVENFGFETNINVLGITSSVENRSTTGEPDTKITKTDIDFKLALINLTFSFSYYF